MVCSLHTNSTAFRAVPNVLNSRFANYKNQPLRYAIPASFRGTFEALGVTEGRKERSGVRAAIIREKGVNGDREMAYSLFLAGFDVKDVPHDRPDERTRNTR